MTRLVPIVGGAPLAQPAPPTHPSTIPETQWAAKVADLAHLFGWHVAHFRPARNAAGGWRTPVGFDGAGFPDLVLTHDTGRVIFAELKTGRGQLQPRQQLWRDWLIAAGADWRLWHPADEPAVRAELSLGRLT